MRRALGVRLGAAEELPKLTPPNLYAVGGATRRLVGGSEGRSLSMRRREPPHTAMLISHAYCMPITDDKMAVGRGQTAATMSPRISVLYLPSFSPRNNLFAEFSY